FTSFPRPKSPKPLSGETPCCEDPVFDETSFTSRTRPLDCLVTVETSRKSHIDFEIDTDTLLTL
ncbi:MAG: hypothetical protein ACK56I_31265, partial [bacterium]